MNDELYYAIYVQNGGFLVEAFTKELLYEFLMQHSFSSFRGPITDYIVLGGGEVVVIKGTQMVPEIRFK